MFPTISVVTPSYSRDFESCSLLCESMDRYVVGYEMHHIVVGDEDAALFAALAGPKRRIVKASELLPRLWPVAVWRGRSYWWAPGLGMPIYGWHLQQMRKIAMALAQTSDRVMLVDSDNCFCRPLDLSLVAAEPKMPHFVRSGEITPERPNHVVWLRNAHRMLGLSAPSLPADDFIGPMIVWERQSVRSMIDRIEAVSGNAWWRVLARIRDFSEYLIYGVAVAADPVLADRHQRTSQSRCLTYWAGPALDEAGLSQFMAGLEPHQSAITIQSHTRTPVELIRRAALRKAAG